MKINLANTFQKMTMILLIPENYKQQFLTIKEKLKLITRITMQKFTSLWFSLFLLHFLCFYKPLTRTTIFKERYEICEVFLQSPTDHDILKSF